MPCYHPLQGYKSRFLNKTGKRSIVFSPVDGYVDLPVTLACGQCLGCKLERSRQWAIRCIHEAQLHEDNCFITLTYSDKHLPHNKSLNKKHYQLFMKRLRRAHPDKIIRYFHCGEYGEKLMRPHYHAALFGHDFKDKKTWKRERDTVLSISAELTELWPFGFSTVGTLTFESAAYVARYIVKKITGESAPRHYEQINFETGEIHTLIPEYTTMSLKPGIGAKWYEQFKHDVFPDDFVIHKGKKLPPPKYYLSIFQRESPEQHERLLATRKKSQLQHGDNATPERLRVRETVKKSQIRTLKRNYEASP